jgi:hypothetical protein
LRMTKRFRARSWPPARSEIRRARTSLPPTTTRRRIDYSRSGKATPETYCDAIAAAAQSMRPLNRLILFGHGRVANAAVPSAVTRVTTGIILGASDLTASNASLLRRLRGKFAREAQAELWVCEAAAAGAAGGQSGVLLCQSIADALEIPVLAATIEQEYTTSNQQEIQGGGWQSTAQFLPWEGTTVLFTPRHH